MRLIAQIVVGLFIIVLLAVGFYIFPSNIPDIPESTSSGQPGSSEVILKSEFPMGPSEMMVYSVVPDNPREKAQEIAQKLGLSEDLNQVEEYSLYTNDGNWIFSYTISSGAFHYADSGFNSSRNDRPEFLPKEEEGIGIAEDYLKAHDLWEDGAGYRRTSYGYGYILRGANNTKELVSQTMDVYFGRTMNGYRVAGDDIRVTIGGNGSVIGFFKVWRTYKPDKTYPIISAEEAYQELVENRPDFPPINDQPVVITNISLGYVTRAAGEKMELLKPAYGFKYETWYDGDPVNGTWYIPAIPELGEI